MRLLSSLFLCVALALCASLAACGLATPVNTARMPINAAGSPAMTQNEAISLPGYALRNPQYTHGKPALAARTVAALDWLAGQDRLTDDFGLYDPVNRYPWVMLRQEVRGAIGVPAQVPSQALVDGLLAAQSDLDAGNSAAARQILVPPTFPFGPDGTLAALSNLPTFAHTEQAFDELSRNENRSGRPCTSPLNC